MGIVTSYITCPSTRYGAGTRGILTRGRAARDFNNPSQSAEMTLNKLKKKKDKGISPALFRDSFRQILRKVENWREEGENSFYYDDWKRIGMYSFVLKTKDKILDDAKVKSLWRIASHRYFSQARNEDNVYFPFGEMNSKFYQILDKKKKEKEILDRRKFFDIL